LLVAESLRAAETLEGEGISARVIDMHTIKPLDRDAIAKAARETGAIVVSEEHLVDGGLGVARSASGRGDATRRHGIRRDSQHLRGIWSTRSSSRQYGLIARDVAAAARRVLKRKRP
jgi:transketolase